MHHKTSRKQTGLIASRFVSAGFLTLLAVQAVGSAQVSSSVDEGVVTMTLLADTVANKALGWL